MMLCAVLNTEHIKLGPYKGMLLLVIPTWIVHQHFTHHSACGAWELKRVPPLVGLQAPTCTPYPT